MTKAVTIRGIKYRSYKTTTNLNRPTASFTLPLPLFSYQKYNYEGIEAAKETVVYELPVLVAVVAAAGVAVVDSVPLACLIIAARTPAETASLRFLFDHFAMQLGAVVGATHDPGCQIFVE